MAPESMSTLGGGAGALRFPADVYELVGDLSALVEQMPGTLALAERAFTAMVEAGHVKVEAGEFRHDPQAAAVTLGTYVGRAVHAAVRLRLALGFALTALADASWTV